MDDSTIHLELPPAQQAALRVQLDKAIEAGGSMVIHFTGGVAVNPLSPDEVQAKFGIESDTDIGGWHIQVSAEAQIQ